MKKSIRIIALLLAILILMGTVFMFLTQIAYGATIINELYKITGIENANGVPQSIGGAIKEGYKASITLTVIDTRISSTNPGSLSIPNDFSVSMQTCGFTSPNSIQVVNPREHSIGGNYYLKYDIVIIGAKYIGSGQSLNVRVNFSDGGIPYAADITNTITECIPTIISVDDGSSSSDDDDEDEDEDSSKTEPATPFVIISAYSTGGGELIAGQSFPLTITFLNTSAKLKVENMMVTLTMPEGLSLTNTSNTIYVESLGAKASQSKIFMVAVKPNAKAESLSIEVDFKYQYVANKVRKDGATSESIALTVSQVDRFQVDPIDLPQQLYEGEEYPLTVSFVNMGRGEIYNLSVEIEGDNLAQPGQRQHVGNLEAGKAGTADFFVAGKTAGTVSGEIVFTYEDLNMNMKTVSLAYTATVMAPEQPMEPDYGEMEGEGEETDASAAGSGWMIWAGAGGATLLTAGFFVFRWLKARKEQQEDDDI